jgi:hypothetical protein
VKDRYTGSLISSFIVLGRRLTSKYSLSELAISSLLLLAIIVVGIGYLSQSLLTSQSTILMVNGSTSYSRDDISRQLDLFAAMDPNPITSRSIGNFLEFLIESEALRLAGFEKYGALSEEEIHSAIVERFGLPFNQSRQEFALAYAELLSNQSVTKTELEIAISGLVYRDKLLVDIRNEVPTRSLGYRMDAIFDSPRRVELLLTAIESGKVFPVASDELGMEIVPASDSGEFWVPDIELQYRFSHEVVAWVESAQEEEVSGVFSLEGIDENKGIYRVSLIKEIGLSDKSIDFLVGKRFQQLIKKSRTAISITSELSSDDRDWLISETALQLR